jgi:hypothetical protein
VVSFDGLTIADLCTPMDITRNTSCVSYYSILNFVNLDLSYLITSTSKPTFQFTWRNKPYFRNIKKLNLTITKINQ